MKKQLNEIKRMQQLAGILKENQQINTVDELKSILYSLVNDYVDDTLDVAGPNLDWDENTKGISKEELIKDFINQLNDDLKYDLKYKIKESQLNEISGDFNISKDTWRKWLNMSDKLGYEDYDLTDHNHLQINHLFQELKWIEENKDKYSTDEELLDSFSNFLDTIGIINEE
jgi:hypothetical protein